MDRSSAKKYPFVVWGINPAPTRRDPSLTFHTNRRPKSVGKLRLVRMEQGSARNYVLKPELKGLLKVIGRYTSTFFWRAPRRGVKFDSEVTLPARGVEERHQSWKVDPTLA